MVSLVSVIFITAFLAITSTQDLNFHFFQNDYLVKPERLEAVSYNKNYVKHMRVATFKYNRTSTAFNLSMIFRIDVGYDDIQVIFQAYKLASNEYRLFPIRVQTSMCNAFQQDIMGIRSFKRCGNTTDCPLVKGRYYYLFNFTPDASKLPPFIPNGSYKIDAQAHYKLESEKVLIMVAYGVVSSPFKGI